MAEYERRSEVEKSKAKKLEECLKQVLTGILINFIINNGCIRLRRRWMPVRPVLTV